MPLKVTMLFQCNTGTILNGVPVTQSHIGGWSESVYYFSDDIVSARAFLLTNGAWGTGLCNARAALLPSRASIIGHRITKVFPRLGRSQTAKNLFPGTAGVDTDVPQMALNCTIPALNYVNIRRFTLRCIPDVYVVTGEYSPSNSYKNAVTTYFASLGANWSFPGQDFTVPVFAVASITIGGVVQLGANPGWVIGDYIQFKDLVASDGSTFSAAGYIETLGPGLNQVTMANWTAGPALGGTGRKYQLILMTMNANLASADRISVRKVGRPFDQYRGRRSKTRVA